MCIWVVSVVTVHFPDEETEAQGAHLSYHSQRAVKCQSQEASDPSPSKLPFLHIRQACLFWLAGRSVSGLRLAFSWLLSCPMIPSFQVRIQCFSTWSLLRTDSRKPVSQRRAVTRLGVVILLLHTHGETASNWTAWCSPHRAATTHFYGSLFRPSCSILNANRDLPFCNDYFCIYEILPACISMPYMPTWSPTESRRGHLIPWNWSVTYIVNQFVDGRTQARVF